MKVFEYFTDFPSLSNYKMTDESRKLAEDNYKLFLFMLNKYKNIYRGVIDGDDIEEHIDIFYLVYCRQCYKYTLQQESKHKLSTYLDKAFNSICANAIRHYNVNYMRGWRDNGSVPLDKLTDSDTSVGELIADDRVNVVTQYETTEFLNRVLEYVDRRIQTSKRIKHFDCTGWRVYKEWYTNNYNSIAQFLTYLKSEGLASEDTTAEQTRKVLNYYRTLLKEAVKRGEV